MSQTHRVSGVFTSIRVDDVGYTCINYRGTDVVKFNQDEIILNTGGWRTFTTKLRMNQAAHQFNLGYSVFQKNYEWYVAWKFSPEPILFDGQSITLKR